MRCLYEVLEIERDADDDAVRKAYRRLALRWHPDKNQHRIEEADEKFKEIQNAYEILSDAHERSWYDNHRESILRGGRHQAGATGGDDTPSRPADEPDLYSFFSSSCFNGYADGPRGGQGCTCPPPCGPMKSFYSVYGALFSKIGAQEEAAQAKAGKTARPAPDFGGADSDWADIRRFYDHWCNFSSAKDFAWADKYNLASAPNRQYRRAMESDNLKARRAAKREYNEDVRELAAFVRKRDKRVAVWQAAEAERKAQRAAEDAARREAEKQERLRKAAEYKEAEWMQAGNRDEDGVSGDSDDDADDVMEEQYHCVVCSKFFKSERALQNHERSKKHLEAVAVLRQVLEEEEAALSGVAAAVGSDAEEQAEGAADAGVDGVMEDTPADHKVHAGTVGRAASKKSRKKQKQARKQQVVQQQFQEGSSSDDEASSRAPATADASDTSAVVNGVGKLRLDTSPAAQRARQRTSSRQPHDQNDSGSEEADEEEEQEEGEDELLARLVAQQRKRGGEGSSTCGRGGHSGREGRSGESPPSGAQASSEGGRSCTSAGVIGGETTELPSSGGSDNNPSASDEEGAGAASGADDDDDDDDDDDEDAVLLRMAAAQQRGAAAAAGFREGAEASSSRKEGGHPATVDDVPGDRCNKARKGRASVVASGQLLEEEQRNRAGHASDEDSDWGIAAAKKKGGNKKANRRKTAVGEAGGAGGSAATAGAVLEEGKDRGKQRGKAAKTGKSEGTKPAAAPLVCAVCGAEFVSRTKLFSHIRTEGHAQLRN